MNAWTVGLAGGLLEGAPIRLAAEMARVVDDGPNMHVLPIVTRGATENLNSLLYLRGVDTAIINSDALEEYKIQVPDIRRRITYLLNLFPSELHIFVRPEIQSLQDLAGKKVNFNTQGTAAAYSGPLIFSRLGINVEKTFIPHQVALEQMRKGEMAAVVFITSKPVDAFVRGRWEPGFKFLPVNYESKFEDYYLPAALEASEYPSLIKQGERVSTIAVPTVLVAFNWPAAIEPLPARRPLRRLSVFPDRQAAGAGLRPEMEVDQSRRDGPRPRPLPGGAGMAGSSGARSAGAAMKTAAIPLSVAFEVASGVAFAQGASDPVAHLRACSLMERAERLECLENCRATSRAGVARRQAATTGSSARPPRPWTIRRSSSPPRLLAAARTAPRCSSPFTAAAAAPNSWSQDRPSPAAARITPSPIASMTISRCSLRPARHRLEPASRSGATSCACCSRSPRRAKSPSVFPRERVLRRRDISCSAA